MNSKLIYEYVSYKQYVGDWLEAQPRSGHGLQSRIAAAVKCHTPYVSRVLHGEAHFSLEQAEALNTFLGHSKAEAHFFLLLVLYERAGSKPLRAYFKEQMAEALAAHLNLANRLASTFELSALDQQRYFESWYIAALHMLVTIPGTQTIDALCAKTRWPRSRVVDILRFLTEVGLVECRSGIYQTSRATLHLSRDAPMVRQHHINWRLAAMEDISAAGATDDLHYSSFVSVSRADFLEIKARFIDELERTSRRVAASPAEVPVCLNIDLFEGFKE